MKRIIAMITFSILSHGAAASELFDLFGLKLQQPVSNYTTQKGNVDAYTGGPYMEVFDFIPPMTNRDFNDYTLSYNMKTGLVDYVNGWIAFNSLDSCKQSARNIAPKLENKYGIKYELEDFSDGANFYFQFSHLRTDDYTNVLCHVAGGYQVNLIVEIGTVEYSDALRKSGDNF